MVIRYHFDEHVNQAIANGLRRRDIEVRTTAEAQLTGASDEEQLAAADADNRVLVTHDDDHLRLHDRGFRHAGIAYCHPRSRSIGQIVLALTRLWRTRTAEEMRGRVEFL